MEPQNSGQHSETQQGSVDDDADLIELRRRIARLRPERRDQLSDWMMEQKLSKLAAEFDHALRIFDYASLDIDSENGPFSSTKTGD
jgi:hypothetical protein